MSLPPEFFTSAFDWLSREATAPGIVVTCRGRFARNLEQVPFAPHAQAIVLASVRQRVAEAFSRSAFFDDFYSLELNDLVAGERSYLKEARLLSKEMERGGPNRAVYVRRDFKASVMINEEDHLRIQCLEPGLQLGRALAQLASLDEEVSRVLPYAFHPRFGYLAACPTNVGTGLRASVMMHLPGLVMQRMVEQVLSVLPAAGFTARGFHGENSENTGDFFQVSNEVTLGKTVEQIGAELSGVVGTILEREREARRLLHAKGGLAVQDAIWRSFGVLRHARRIDTAEAMKLLSRVRLGIDEGYFHGEAPHLTHEALNRLVMEIQPAHLAFRHDATEDGEARDIARAAFLRGALDSP